MKKILAVISAGLALASLNNTSFAAIHDGGAYIEGNIGTLYSSFSLFDDEYTKFGSVGLNTNLGYQFNRYLAAEAGYTSYGSNSLNNVDVAAKFILPVTNDFSLSAKIGPAYIFKSGDSEFVPLAGIGAAYSITQSMDINVQAQGISNGFFSIGLISGGLTYHFG